MDEVSEPLLIKHSNDNNNNTNENEEEEDLELKKRVWIETKKLWGVVGPSIFGRVAAYTMNVVTQSFAGHLGDLELASISIANTVVVGFVFGFLVQTNTTTTSYYCSLTSFLEHLFLETIV
ncbi:hypothetical protein LguiA_006455 [Lonicera macranthoides]